MSKHLGSDALTEAVGSGAHGFDFAVALVEFFQCAAAGEVGAVPNAPESDVGFAQAIEIQRVTAFGRGNLHAAEVLFEESDDFGAGEVVGADLQKLSFNFHQVVSVSLNCDLANSKVVCRNGLDR